MITVSTLSIFVPSAFVGLRLYARKLTQRTLEGSDYCILVGLVGH